MKPNLSIAESSYDFYLTPLIDCLTKIRDEIAQAKNKPDRLNLEQLEAIERTLQSSPNLRCRDELLQQLKLYRDRNGEEKNLFKSSTEPLFLAAFFDVRYAPDPFHFEFFEYETVPVPKAISDEFFAIALSVNLRRGSPGLRSDRVVALFPENWKFKNKLALDLDDQVFYFNNRFVERYFKYSIPMIQQFTDSSCFRSILNLKPSEVAQLSALWTWMHEHYHHNGALPLPRFLHYKDSKAAAAFEELRVDVGAIANLSQVAWMKEEAKQRAMEFVLCERILRYPIQCVPNENYDSIGSQMLFTFLNKHGYLSCKEHTLTLKKDWVQGIIAFSKELSRCEIEASKMDPKSGKNHLTQFARSLANFNQSTGRYELLDYYANCRRVMRLDSNMDSLKKAA